VGEGKGESDEDNGNEDNDGHVIHHYLHGFCLHGCCKQGEGVSEGEGGMGVGERSWAWAMWVRVGSMTTTVLTSR